MNRIILSSSRWSFSVRFQLALYSAIFFFVFLFDWAPFSGDRLASYESLEEKGALFLVFFIPLVLSFLASPAPKLFFDGRQFIVNLEKKVINISLERVENIEFFTHLDYLLAPRGSGNLPRIEISLNKPDPILGEKIIIPSDASKKNRRFVMDAFEQFKLAKNSQKREPSTFGVQDQEENS